MIWLTVDEDGREFIHDSEPGRNYYCDKGFWMPRGKKDEETGKYSSVCLELPNGSIEKLIGRKLIWQDEPVEY